MHKKIACIGWGSLVWDRRGLPVVGDWMADGPMLPIEFARESQDGRVTLVLCDDVPLVQSCWALISVENMSYAIEALAEREGIKRNVAKSIGWWDAADGKARGKCADEIETWAKSQWLDGVVWTNLSYGLRSKPNVMPSVDEVVAHMEKLNGDSLERALHYLRMAPAQIDTVYRRKIRERWSSR